MTPNRLHAEAFAWGSRDGGWLAESRALGAATALAFDRNAFAGVRPGSGTTANACHAAV